MQFQPADVVARASFRLPAADSAEAAVRTCRPLQDELRPLAVEARAAGPDEPGEGFTVEFLLKLPAPQSDDVEGVLRTAAAPLLARLGLDAGKLDVDVEDRDAIVWAGDEALSKGGTACGAYVVHLRIGRDPDEPHELLPEGSLTDEEARALTETLNSLFEQRPVEEH
ncbi:hypothetical protein [Streptomyces hiroshimensis]|uniref:Uncharacterized protein n=1 Tax=Streptomyces hiroshimensis TaxID=66424 RepID=A0ABQ2YJL7_9ACTN|nr:hypothetical protein [Streptomyces hiroshimensis]GGX86530.1 hypothetical protein GCM10010324_35080 [Streptomyces hiroshimensis]